MSIDELFSVPKGHLTQLTGWLVRDCENTKPTASSLLTVLWWPKQRTTCCVNEMIIVPLLRSSLFLNVEGHGEYCLWTVVLKQEV